MPKWILPWLIWMACLGVSGCVPGTAQRTGELLATEYQALTDDELRSYYHQLSDQLARESRATRISGGRRDAGAQDGSTSAGEDLSGEEQLRLRWNDVRQELRRRNLLR